MSTPSPRSRRRRARKGTLPPAERPKPFTIGGKIKFFQRKGESRPAPEPSQDKPRFCEGDVVVLIHEHRINSKVVLHPGTHCLIETGLKFLVTSERGRLVPAWRVASPGFVPLPVSVVIEESKLATVAEYAEIIRKERELADAVAAVAAPVAGIVKIPSISLSRFLLSDTPDPD